MPIPYSKYLLKYFNNKKNSYFYFMYKLSTRSKERLKGVDSRLIQIIEKALPNSPFDFGIPPYGGLRKAQEQNKLFIDKKSQLDGYTKKSKHQLGKAFDIYIFDHSTGKASWDKKMLTAVADHILCTAQEMRIPLRWGNDWDMDGIPVEIDPDERFSDMPHFELI